MNRTEYSLSLDSVICHRCNTLSRAEEDTCPFCGADRQGAIFTSAAEVAATAAAAAAPASEQLDIVDLLDTGWLKRVVRPQDGDVVSEPRRAGRRTAAAAAQARAHGHRDAGERRGRRARGRRVLVCSSR
ncbi:hypothetical protein BPUN_1917 [Candidatus Paraburkholderia kirkii]|nr:hypothetical protein BPUN_1917 [Candidatus Paraburkholderia kirkii]